MNNELREHFKRHASKSISLAECSGSTQSRRRDQVLLYHDECNRNMNSPPINRILFVTDLWLAQPYGILTVISNIKRELEKKGCAVDILEPSQFFTVPFPLYKSVRLALFSRGSVRRKIFEGNYDEIHIVTEGPLGWYTRSACRRLGIPFTTAFHAQLHLYAETWLAGFIAPLVRRLIVWFPAGATLT